MKRPTSLLAFLNAIPPPVVRLLAREKRRLLTATEIAQRGGLTVGMVTWVEQQPTWDNIVPLDIERFWKGCGLDLSNRASHLKFLRRTSLSNTPLSHIKGARAQKTLAHASRFSFSGTISHPS